MSISFKVAAFAGASLLTLSAATLPASAQDTDDEARLAPVVTTAQRVEENVQDVPVSLTIVDGEKLDNLKASGADIRFLSARVPSVIAESSFGRAFPRFYIRGIGNTDFDLNASQPVSLVYDQVPYESPILKGFPVFDVENIEVLRGPQGTLFGRNTPGGIIKFDSVKPGHETDAYVRAAYGTYNTVDLEGAVGGSIFQDELAFRLSGLFQQRDDYVDNAAPGFERKDAFEGFEESAIRGQLLFTPDGTDFSALLNLHARSNEGSARLFRANIIGPGSNDLNENFDRETVFTDGQNFLTQDTNGVTLTLEKGIGQNWDLTYVLGSEHAEIESRGDIDGGFGAAFLDDEDPETGPEFGPGFIPFPVQTSGQVDRLSQNTHELRAAFDNGGQLRAQAGVFLFDEVVKITSRNFDTFAPGQPQDGPAARRSLDTESVGVFTSLEYDVTPLLTLGGGLRWTDDEKRFVSGSDDRTLGDDQVSWDVSATYAYSDDINLYGRIAKGFRGPTVQQRFGAPSQADSETVISYEAGAKTELYDNRVRLNTSVYFYEINDQQLTIVGGAANEVSLFNADKSEGYGFEADIEAAPIANLLLTAGLSYNNTEFKDDFLVADGCGGGCTVLDPQAFDANGDPILNAFGGPTFVISGNSFPNAPEWIGNVTARYGMPFWNGELYGFTDWAYKGDTNFFLYDSAEFGQDGYWEGGLRLGYVDDRGYQVSVFGRNITDEEALTGGIDFNNLTGFVNEPQTFGIEVRWDH